MQTVSSDLYVLEAQGFSQLWVVWAEREMFMEWNSSSIQIRQCPSSCYTWKWVSKVQTVWEMIQRAREKSNCEVNESW